MDMYLLFVRQAYDSINRYSLWKAMTQLGILAKLVRACVSHFKWIVRFNGESEDFSVKTGLRQGDPIHRDNSKKQMDKLGRSYMKNGQPNSALNHKMEPDKNKNREEDQGSGGLTK